MIPYYLQRIPYYLERPADNQVPTQQIQPSLMQNPYKGLLGDDDLGAANNQGLLNAGAALLAASGPSPNRMNLAQTLGLGLQGFSQGRQSAMDNTLKIKMFQHQLQKDNETELTRNARAAGINPGTPEFAKLFGSKLTGEAPSSVREYEYFSKLDDKGRATFMGLKRQGWKIDDIGGVPHLISLSPDVPPIPLSNLAKEAGGKAAIAGATEDAKTTAEARAKAKLELGSSLDEINKMRAGIDDLTGSPGFSTIYGASGVLDPRNAIPGTDASDAKARLGQLDAMSFGIAIQKMRGLGALSDAEGKKVSTAFTMATNRNISDKKAKEAWDEVKQYLNMAEQRLKEKAGAEPASIPASPASNSGWSIKKK